ncbi:MAG TPA: hypothetical protein VJ720_11225 [Chitinophaga sp.]|nr:hypothetical protein [Chitinophaga sp.]
MQVYYMSAGNPGPGSIPGKDPGPEITPPSGPQGPPTQPGPEITPPPSPQGPPEKTPDEIPGHDIERNPPTPKAKKKEEESEERAEKIAEQDREDVEERSPDLFPDPTIMETGDTYDQEDSVRPIPEE